MRGSKIIENYERCQIFDSMLEGLKVMILKAPNNEKKQMLNDVIKLGEKISDNYKKHLNGNEYLEFKITSLEIALKQAQHEAKYNSIMLEKFKKGI